MGTKWVFLRNNFGEWLNGLKALIKINHLMNLPIQKFRIYKVILSKDKKEKIDKEEDLLEVKIKKNQMIQNLHQILLLLILKTKEIEIEREGGVDQKAPKIKRKLCMIILKINLIFMPSSEICFKTEAKKKLKKSWIVQKRKMWRSKNKKKPNDSESSSDSSFIDSEDKRDRDRKRRRGRPKGAKNKKKIVYDNIEN